MNTKYLIFPFLFFQLLGSQAQHLETTKTINSTVLNEERALKILLPPNYSKEKTYPVVYITDATYNFEIAASYITQLIKFNAIPNSILVGIPQKNRGNELDIFWNEDGIQFKNFIFNEVIPFIDNEYKTSDFNAIIGHSDGAEYNHLLLMEKDNPFRGFINISENLYNNVQQQISTYFKNYKGKQLYYFIANAEFDMEDRIDAGNVIEQLFLESNNKNIHLQKKTYNADHQNVLSKALLDGLLLVFKDYRNNLNYPNFKEYVENYQKNIQENYGFIPDLNENDIDFFFGKILEEKDLEHYEYLIRFTSEKNIFSSNTLDRANHYFYMNAYAKTVEYWNKTVAEFHEISPRVFYFNFTKAIDAYLELKNPNGAIEFLEKCKKRLPEYSLTFNYFIAKTALENKVQKSIGKKYLNYCEQNFTENRYFKQEDLQELKETF